MSVGNSMKAQKDEFGEMGMIVGDESDLLIGD